MFWLIVKCIKKKVLFLINKLIPLKIQNLKLRITLIIIHPSLHMRIKIDVSGVYPLSKIHSNNKNPEVVIKMQFDCA